VLITTDTDGTFSPVTCGADISLIIRRTGRVWRDGRQRRIGAAEPMPLSPDVAPLAGVHFGTHSGL
jgi:hypothetical protein